jgi:hypothetical protein
MGRLWLSALLADTHPKPDGKALKKLPIFRLEINWTLWRLLMLSHPPQLCPKRRMHQTNDAFGNRPLNTISQAQPRLDHSQEVLLSSSLVALSAGSTHAPA